MEGTTSFLAKREQQGTQRDWNRVSKVRGEFREELRCQIAQVSWAIVRNLAFVKKMRGCKHGTDMICLLCLEFTVDQE